MSGGYADGEPLVFRGQLTEDDVVELQACHDLVRFRRPFRWLARGFVVFVGAILVWSFTTQGPNVVTVPLLIACVYLLFILPSERTWQVRRTYRRYADVYLETEARLTGEWVSICNDNQRSEFAWRLVGGVAESRSGILLYDRWYRAILWLPDRLLENGLRERVLSLADAQGVRVIRV